MIDTAPAIPHTPADRLRWAVIDSWTLTRRSLRYWVRSPQEIVGGLLFPIVSVLLFGYVLGTALLVGWRPHGTVGETVAAVALLLLLRFALVWVGIVLGLVLRTTESISVVWPLVLPFAMVANTFVAPELMPRWIGTLAEWNPMSATVDATRELFHSPGLGGGSWVADHGMLMALVWPLALLAAFLPLAVWRFRRLSHTQ